MSLIRHLYIFSTLILFLGIILTEYQRKNYYQDLRCKNIYFIICFYKRVALIRIELFGQEKWKILTIDLTSCPCPPLSKLKDCIF